MTYEPGRREADHGRPRRRPDPLFSKESILGQSASARLQDEERQGSEVMEEARMMLDDPLRNIPEADRGAISNLIEKIEAGLGTGGRVDMTTVRILQNYLNQYL